MRGGSDRRQMDRDVIEAAAADDRAAHFDLVDG
jgi:hypothetical protein